MDKENKDVSIMGGFSKSSISSHRINTTTYQVWYYLPSYPNYSPSGLPDFDQRQNSTWKRGFIWSFCGPVALANIF